MGQASIEHAYEILVGGDGSSPLVLTCEHASNRVPAPHAWPDEDAWLADTHWAHDIGAEAITRALVEQLSAVAVLARFTRLLVDPNRELESTTLFRERADGEPVRLNVLADEDERQARIASLYRPFHGAIDQVLTGRPPGLMLSIHTFTPHYEGGDLRPMEMGVLFDHDRDEAFRLADAFASQGLVTALNEPYSGLNGLMYSVQSHAARHGWKAIELEIRQDLSSDPDRTAHLATAILEGLLGAQLL